MNASKHKLVLSLQFFYGLEIYKESTRTSNMSCSEEHSKFTLDVLGVGSGCARAAMAVRVFLSFGIGGYKSILMNHLA